MRFRVILFISMCVILGENISSHNKKIYINMLFVLPIIGYFIFISKVFFSLFCQSKFLKDDCLLYFPIAVVFWAIYILPLMFS